LSFVNVNAVLNAAFNSNENTIIPFLSILFIKYIIISEPINSPILCKEPNKPNDISLSCRAVVIEVLDERNIPLVKFENIVDRNNKQNINKRIPVLSVKRRGMFLEIN
jgi:hypothetical protein